MTWTSLRRRLRLLEFVPCPPAVFTYSMANAHTWAAEVRPYPHNATDWKMEISIRMPLMQSWWQCQVSSAIMHCWSLPFHTIAESRTWFCRILWCIPHAYDFELPNISNLSHSQRHYWTRTTCPKSDRTYIALRPDAFRPWQKEGQGLGMWKEKSVAM